MPLTVVSNDSRATRIGQAGGSTISQMNVLDTQKFFDDAGFVGAIGRGATDADITFIELQRDDGTSAFIYPNAAGNGIIVQTTKP